MTVEEAIDFLEHLRANPWVAVWQASKITQVIKILKDVNI